MAPPEPATSAAGNESALRGVRRDALDALIFALAVASSALIIVGPSYLAVLGMGVWVGYWIFVLREGEALVNRRGWVDLNGKFALRVDLFLGVAAIAITAVFVLGAIGGGLALATVVITMNAITPGLGHRQTFSRLPLTSSATMGGLIVMLLAVFAFDAY